MCIYIVMLHMFPIFLSFFLRMPTFAVYLMLHTRMYFCILMFPFLYLRFFYFRADTFHFQDTTAHDHLFDQDNAHLRPDASLQQHLPTTGYTVHNQLHELFRFAQLRRLVYDDLTCYMKFRHTYRCYILTFFRQFFFMCACYPKYPGFPGKIVVLAGDGRQIPPVVPGGGQSETCAASIMSSSYYRDNVQVRNLTKTMRNKEDPPFSKMVDKIGDGLPAPDLDGLVDIPGVGTETDLQSSLDFVFPPHILADPRSCSKHCVVTLHNDNVDIINDVVLNRVPGDIHSLEGRTLLNHELLEGDLDDAFVMADYLSTLQHSGVPPHILKLKVGVCVMLTRNLDVSAGLTNGAKVVVMTILPYTLKVSTLKDGTIHWIPRITFPFITWQGMDVKRVQFPVRLAFAVTVHRSQGQTLDRVVLDLRRDVFMHGCLYVGLSRVRNSNDVKILTTEHRLCPDHLSARAVNVVYSSLVPEILD